MIQNVTPIKERDPFYDNARFILVALVVFGHLLAPIRSDHYLLYELYNFLGLFRMPALIILTGFLSKGFLKEGYIEKITKRILVPFLIFQFIMGYYYYFLYERSVFSIDFLAPQYTLWFLLSLFIWNMLLFVFTKIKYPLLFAVLIGVLIGYSDGAGHHMAILRTFTFFPFFLLGFYMKKEHFEWVKKPLSKLVAAVVMVVSWLILASLFDLGEAASWLSGNRTYEAMGYEAWYIGGVRLFLYGLAIAVGFAFLTFVPKRKTFFTVLGTRTPYIYILHGAIIRTLHLKYFPETFTSIWEYALIPVTAIILALILSSKPVVFLTKPFITGKIIDYIFALSRYIVQKVKDISSKDSVEEEAKRKYYGS